MKSIVSLALPAGRIQKNFFTLLSDAGITLRGGARSYRPSISLAGFDVKILRTQNIVEMLALGRRDIGIAGLDWVIEKQANIIELLDTGLDPVRIVAAAPAGFPNDSSYQDREVIIASEYVGLAAQWALSKNLRAKIIRSYGTTEAFAPEDADCIVDNTSTGETLAASKLVIIDQLLASSTRIFASHTAMDDRSKRDKIEDLVLLLRSVLEARSRVVLEVNVAPQYLDAVAAALPCMRVPTISELFGGAGFVVKAAVPKNLLPTLIPQIKQRGGTDIIVTPLANVIP